MGTSSIASGTTTAIPAGALGGEETQSAQERIRRLVEALEEPFDPKEVKWRVTNTSKDRRRGQVIAYADPRAYTDRLNAVFTVSGWTRKYSIQTINNVERKFGNEKSFAGKIVVACEVSIHALGAHSGLGEEWADNENAGTAAEAQAFKRACACFGLGRYLYSLEGTWVELNEYKQPKSLPKLPDWALPKRKATTNQNGRQTSSAQPSTAAPASTTAQSSTGVQNPEALREQIRTLVSQVGYSLSRWCLMETAKTDNMESVPADRLPATLSRLKDVSVVVERVRKAIEVVGHQQYTKICTELNFASDAIDDIPDHRALVTLIERLKVEAVGKTSGGGTTSPAPEPAGNQQPGGNGAKRDLTAAQQLGQARMELLKEAKRVGELQGMKVAEVVNRAAKEAFKYDALKDLTPGQLPELQKAIKRLRDVR